MSSSNRDGYVIVGPFILSFGLVGALIKGTLLILAILAIPVGAGLSIYSSYRPRRALERMGRMAWSKATTVLTTLGWIICAIGVLTLFDDTLAKYRIVLGLGLLFLRLPFMLSNSAEAHPDGTHMPLSPVRSFFYRIYAHGLNLPWWQACMPGFVIFSGLMVYGSFTNTPHLLSSWESVFASLGMSLAVGWVFGMLVTLAVFYPIFLLLGLAEPWPSPIGDSRLATYLPPAVPQS